VSSEKVSSEKVSGEKVSSEKVNSEKVSSEKGVKYSLTAINLYLQPTTYNS
jgi:hypothetical protein